MWKGVKEKDLDKLLEEARVKMKNWMSFAFLMVLVALSMLFLVVNLVTNKNLFKVMLSNVKVDTV